MGVDGGGMAQRQGGKVLRGSGRNGRRGSLVVPQLHGGKVPERQRQRTC